MWSKAISYFNGANFALNKTMNKIGRLETPNMIFKSQLNNSTSKQQWSFSRAERFPDRKSYTNTICYEIPSSRSRRHSGIGCGNRSSLFDGQKGKSPGPDAYRALSCFIRNDRKGQSFGENRQKIRFANYLKIGEQTPSSYHLCESQVKSSKAYSLRPKTAYPSNYFLPNDEEKERVKQLPGPGNYETVDVMGNGRDFYNSKFKTQKQKSFIGSERFSTSKKTPGPADYNISTTIEADGICFLSTMKSHGRRPILHERRQLKLEGNKDTPGPGQYQKPSDFGHYNKMQRPRTARN